MVTEYKNIPISQIVPNPEQPRETFDREKLKELAESILSNGLINSITVRKKGKQYEIVAGERRWKAHQIAKIGKISALVKEYKSEGQVAVESLIENIHREDLQNMEKAKFLLRIKNIENLTNEKLAKRVGMGETVVRSLLNIISIEKEIKKVGMPTSDYDTLSRIASMEDKFVRDRLLKKGKTTENFRQVVRAVAKATPEVKDALLDDKITVEQAESLTKINSPKAREKALKETISHKKLADITPKLAEKANPELTDALKNKMSSVQKKVFTLLYDGKVTLNKSVASLKKANLLIDGMIANPFEHALPEKLLASMIQQMKSISDMLTQLDMEKDRFDELKETFIGRIEDKL